MYVLEKYELVNRYLRVGRDFFGEEAGDLGKKFLPPPTHLMTVISIMKG